MYKNRGKYGAANLCGGKISMLRQGPQPKVSQRAFMEMLQLAGIDSEKNEIRRIECGKRFAFLNM